MIWPHRQGRRPAAENGCRRPRTEGWQARSAGEIRCQDPLREYVNEYGEKIRTMEHRAGWDATFSAPEVLTTALVGGDERVRDAHRDSVSVALAEMERFVQARLGVIFPPRLLANGLRPSLSTTVPALWMAMQRRSFIRMSCSSTSRRLRMVTRERCSRGNCTNRNSMGRPSIGRNLQHV